ncbi:MAG: hypothetical protein Q9194_004831 [Teloschistes cf. exilis]
MSPNTGNNTSVPEDIDPPEDCDSDDDEQAIKESISDTLVDESVSKTWELNPDLFHFRNPAWNLDIQQLYRNAATQLGISAEASVNAELYKLLLYEEGAMFKPHQDTEKANGMFDTLVVSLPSLHEGGELIARHSGDGKMFATATDSAFQFNHIAWYADVMHEVRPVTSGYRFVVVYNLVRTSPGAVQTAAKLLGEKDELGTVLAAWNQGIKKENSDAPRFLLYQLEHEYTEESLKTNSLKGVDKLKADCLSDEDDDEDGHHVIEDVLDTSLETKRLVDLDGTLLGQGIDVGEQDFILDDPFARDPDHEDYEEYMGNYGPDATHFYYDSVCGHFYPRCGH